MRILLWVVLAVVGLLAASPWLLYEAGLSKFAELPEPSAAPLRPEQEQWLHCEFRAEQVPDSFTVTPWNYIFLMRAHAPALSYGDRLAGFVARGYTFTQLANRRTMTRLFSAISLTIWIERHWTVQQVAAQAHIQLQHASRFHCPPGPAEWQP